MGAGPAAARGKAPPARWRRMSNDQPPYRTGDDAWPAGSAGRGGAGKAPDGWGSGSGWGPQGAERGFGRPDEPTIVLPPGYQPPPGDTYAPLPPPELPGAPTTVLPKAEGQRKRGVSRRTVLIGAGVGAVGVGALGAGVGLLLARNNGGSGAANLMTDEAGKVGHLLRRAGFGAAPWDVADYVNAGVDGAIERLLNYQNIPDDLDARLQSLNLDFSKPADMVRWFMLRALYSKH